jgi:hypothetical protein
MELLNPMSNPQFAAQSASYTGTAGSTTGWPAGPQGVVIWSTTAAYVVVGEGVTATATNGTPIPANTPIPFIVPQGTGAPWRVSAIQIASAGTVYAKPINIR